MPPEPGSRPARFGGAEAVGCVLLALLAIAFIGDLGVSSFVCMDSDGNNLACALGVVAGHWPVYLAGLAVIGLSVAIVRRVTR